MGGGGGGVIYFYFFSIKSLSTEVVDIFEIFQWLVYPTYSTPWLLMAWRCRGQTSYVDLNIRDYLSHRYNWSDWCCTMIQSLNNSLPLSNYSSFYLTLNLTLNCQGHKLKWSSRLSKGLWHFYEHCQVISTKIVLIRLEPREYRKACSTYHCFITSP